MIAADSHVMVLLLPCLSSCGAELWWEYAQKTYKTYILPPSSDAQDLDSPACFQVGTLQGVEFRVQGLGLWACGFRSLGFRLWELGQCRRGWSMVRRGGTCGLKSAL